jgi:predicted anti-sigma-YlaC factor YlaD
MKGLAPMLLKSMWYLKRLVRQLLHPRRGSYPAGRYAHRPIIVLALALLALSASACAIVINQAGKALVSGNSVYATDNDPELVWEAVPFGLKTIEGLLAQSPKNKNLLLAAASGFTQYAYGHLQQDADFMEASDLAAATALRTRTRKMCLRALDYGLRGLEVDLPDFRTKLRQDPQTAVCKLKKEQVPLIYWTANAWGDAIAISKDNAELTADQNLVEALMRRALELDESWELGSIHDFFIAYEGGRSSVGGSLTKAREHFARATQLSQGTRISPLVSYAETICVSTQNRKEFQSLLEEASAFDADKTPETRVANLIAQRRARWLLGRIDELFIE